MSNPMEFSGLNLGFPEFESFHSRDFSPEAQFV